MECEREKTFEIFQLEERVIEYIYIYIYEVNNLHEPVTFCKIINSFR